MNIYFHRMPCMGVWWHHLSLLKGKTNSASGLFKIISYSRFEDGSELRGYVVSAPRRVLKSF